MANSASSNCCAESTLNKPLIATAGSDCPAITSDIAAAVAAAVDVGAVAVAVAFTVVVAADAAS